MLSDQMFNFYTQFISLSTVVDRLFQEVLVVPPRAPIFSNNKILTGCLWLKARSSAQQRAGVTRAGTRRGRPRPHPAIEDEERGRPHP